MKTSPKTTVALLAILALGGSTAGSLSAESLQTNQIGSIGTAGAFFSDSEIKGSAYQSKAPSDKSKSVFQQDLVNLRVEAGTLTSVLLVKTQALTVASPEAISSLPLISEPKPTLEISNAEAFSIAQLSNPKAGPQLTNSLSADAVTPTPQPSTATEALNDSYLLPESGVEVSASQIPEPEVESPEQITESE